MQISPAYQKPSRNKVFLWFHSLDVNVLHTPHWMELYKFAWSLFKEDKIVYGFHKKQVFDMLSMTSKELVILFDNKY